MAIDVIIPCYNAAPTIERAIASVLRQSDCGEVRIIIVDDGSTDQTSETVLALSDPRITLLRQENLGPAAARNAGIAASRAEWIAFLDADDVWLPGKIAHQLVALASADGGFVAHLVSFRRVWDGGRVEDHILPPTPFLRDRLLDVCGTTIGSTMLARRSLFEQLGTFAPQLRSFEDWDLQLRCFLAGKQILTSPDIFVVKYEGASRSGPIVSSAVRFLRETRAPEIASNFGRASARRFRSALAFEEAINALYQAQWVTAVEHILSSVVLWPRRTGTLIKRGFRFISSRQKTLSSSNRSGGSGSTFIDLTGEVDAPPVRRTSREPS